MYDICHPSYYQLCKLGCNDPVKTSTAFYVYIELCEVKRFWDVKYKYNQELDLFYFEVWRNQNSSLEIYVPWSTKYSISLDKIERMQQVLQSERLTLVFKSEDSNSICYTVSKGLVKPTAPEVTKELKEKEEKKSNLETEIRKNTSNLYELAKDLVCENSNPSCSSDADANVNVSIESANVNLTADTLNIGS